MHLDHLSHQPRRRRWRLARTVRRGELLPRGYGVAWARWYADECVALPIPLNVIAGAAYRTWGWFKRGGVSIPDCSGAAYRQGYEDATRHAIARETGWMLTDKDCHHGA